MQTLMQIDTNTYTKACLWGSKFSLSQEDIKLTIWNICEVTRKRNNHQKFIRILSCSSQWKKKTKHYEKNHGRVIRGFFHCKIHWNHLKFVGNRRFQNLVHRLSQNVAVPSRKYTLGYTVIPFQLDFMCTNTSIQQTGALQFLISCWPREMPHKPDAVMKKMLFI